MAPREVILYTDYKSPYAYLANEGAYQLEEDFDIRLDWRPYTLDIPSYLGAVDSRDPHQWRRVKYSYMDCRRMANERGLTVLGPKKIFDSSIASIGMLYAKRAGSFRAYNDTVFERFWKRDLDIEDASVVKTVLREVGVAVDDFDEYLAGDGRAEHTRVRDEAEEMGVFGVPMFVVEGELFWGGDRIPILRRKLAQLEGKAD
jgi:2-hydroxychromene-2-carboxylate isomerase